MPRLVSFALSTFALTTIAPFVVHAATPPAPVGPTPTERQLAWHEIETYGFIHFGLNTFTGREWGYGDEDPKMFNPVEFDADQIVGAFKAAGLKGVLMVAKHHDGFCLWPTKSTSHNISQSPFKNGKGDLVREVSEACKRAGMKFGVYVSPWDRNNPEYGKPGYVEAFHKQIEELVTQYGPMFEIWFDGANGGDGWYGGAKTKRTIDKDTYYQWDKVRDLIRKNQPEAVIFSGGFPDVRWVGNERGVAGEVCRNTISSKIAKPSGENAAVQNRGEKTGDRWVPAECDVSIRPGWFYHADQDARVKTPRQLLDLYFVSVGRGASFLLNIPPDKRGLVHGNDVKSLQGFGVLLKQIFSNNLATGAKASSDETRGQDETGFGPAKTLDTDRHSYWTTCAPAPSHSRCRRRAPSTSYACVSR
jgi:alpha-L-fucosidase